MQLRISKQTRRLIYLGLAVYLIVLFNNIPASFLSRYLLPALPVGKLVNLEGVKGSIWRGTAMNASVDRVNIGKLSWDLSGWGLLLGHINLTLDFHSPVSKGHGRVSIGLGGSVSAEDIQAQFPAEILTPLFYGFPISFDGELHGNIISLDLEPGRTLNCKGRILWRAAALRSPQHVELGDFVVALEPNNLGSKLEIKDGNTGPVQADLNIHLKGSGEYKLNGWLKSRDESQQHIAEALRLIGRADNSGKYWLTRNGALRGWK